jgi:VIT1/CCC1 family predicted Fe2+/Mn2+ transporter
MTEKKLSPHIEQILIRAQKKEQTEYMIYTKLSERVQEKQNRKLLRDIASQEKDHYAFWKKYTGKSQKANDLEVLVYVLIAKTLGISFAVKLMEKGEQNAQKLYEQVKSEVPGVKKIINEEEKHEQDLLKLINEERLSYIGSIVLGLNDALVELTGALAGLTLALQNARLVAVAGLITGIAASFSMAASEYLSVKTEKNGKNPITAAFYTGIVYIVTVAFLITPYLLISNLYVSLALSLSIAIFIILIFTFYTSVAQNRPFASRFLEMAGLSMGVAFLTFIIGFVVRQILHIEL